MVAIGRARHLRRQSPTFRTRSSEAVPRPPAARDSYLILAEVTRPVAIGCAISGSLLLFSVHLVNPPNTDCNKGTKRFDMNVTSLRQFHDTLRPLRLTSYCADGRLTLASI